MRYKQLFEQLNEEKTNYADIDWKKYGIIKMDWHTKAILRYAGIDKDIKWFFDGLLNKEIIIKNAKIEIYEIPGGSPKWIIRWYDGEWIKGKWVVGEWKDNSGKWSKIGPPK